ncbi:MAG: protease pro-enzyme activation domain-containing protein, partial [Firmicutes bacterium]|nr:protease pro-enzyme activation domain-containing protein [Bacillota bacterium]
MWIKHSIGSAVAAATSILFAGSPITSAAHALTPHWVSLPQSIDSHLLSLAKKIGPANPSRHLTIQLALNWRNSSALSQYIHSEYTPGSAHYLHYLTPQQFNARYAPSSAQIHTLSTYLQKNGLSIHKVSANHDLITVTGTVADISRAFSTHLDCYQKSGQTFIANSSHLQLPQSISALVTGLVGLDTYHNFTPGIIHTPSVQGAPDAGSQSSANKPTGYSPQQIEKVYGASSLIKNGDTGHGVTIAIATLATFLPKDATTFWKYY